MTLEHPGEAQGHLLAGLTDGHRAGDVGGAVQVLGARIHQVKGARLQVAVGLLGDMIVDDGAVPACPGNGVAAQAPEMLPFAAE